MGIDQTWKVGTLAEASVGFAPVRLVSEHLADVEASLASLETLRKRLAHIHDELVSDRAPDISALISVLRTMGSSGPASEQTVPSDNPSHDRSYRKSSLRPAVPLPTLHWTRWSGGAATRALVIGLLSETGQSDH
ncbi:hypothetical protein ABWJ92_20600 [Streptomyces sp. NPDC000609]|uniref:hypothetical protein n=1 Tax=Streptomyces sp. NPDC000609 TaxID=3160957 RepID=UPI003396061A